MSDQREVPCVVVCAYPLPLLADGVVALLERYLREACEVRRCCPRSEGGRHVPADVVVALAPSTHCLASERSCRCSQAGRPVVMVSTGWLEARDAVQSAGIQGYLGPGSNPVQLGEAVRAVLEGGSVYQPAGGPRRAVGPLTQRQVQVLELLGRGMTDQEIGRKLGISEATVRNHLAALHQRTSAERRGELCALAASGGLLTAHSREGL